MTDFGLRVMNDAGTVLIDTESTALALTSKGSTTFASGSTPWGTGRVASVTVSGTQPVLAFACSSRTFIYNVSQSGSDWTFTFYTLGPAGTDLDYWVFDQAPLAAGPGSYGMRLFRADGSVAWHMDLGVMRIVGLLTNGQTFSGASGRSYATAQAGFGARHDVTVDPSTGTSYLYTIQGASAGSDAYVLYDTYRSVTLPHATGPASETFTETDGSYLVIDVTGL